MKHIINLVKRFKKMAIIGFALMVIVTVALAHNYMYTTYVATELQMKAGAVQNFIATAYQVFATTSYSRFHGTSYIQLGDSAYIDFGTSVARKDSFGTTLGLDTVTMKGATLADGYIVTPITTLTSSTPDTGAQSYYAYHLNGDSIVVGRIAKPGGSTLKSAALYTIFRAK